jgi:hypothetical protein
MMKMAHHANRNGDLRSLATGGSSDSPCIASMP